MLCKSAKRIIESAALNTRTGVIMMRAVYGSFKKGGTMDGDTNSKEKVVSDLRVLVNDAEELLKATANQAGETIAVARQKIEQSLIEGKKALADAEQTFLKKSKECAEIADDYVRENPWSAVGVAAALGLALGLLIRGK
jgi:ElaB/YqjD/DUF883 family membrane-anchored ribosome-binding protein